MKRKKLDKIVVQRKHGRPLGSKDLKPRKLYFLQETMESKRIIPNASLAYSIAIDIINDLEPMSIN